MKNHIQIFWQFFVLGFISFGGPMAHLGYFRKQFVEKLKWINDESYAKIVALSNFLPGPSSSQVGFTIGLQRGGVVGGILAFLAFTLPSFLMLYFAATLSKDYSASDLMLGIISGLKLFAVVIVADAILGMGEKFCKDKITKLILVVSTIILLFLQSFVVQMIVLVFAGIVGMFLFKEKTEARVHYIKPNYIYLGLFLFLLFVVPLFFQNELAQLFHSFYQVGSVVFGGGHVVLPLLSSNIEVAQEEFLVAYSLAQAVPGPMFTIASYLGAIGYESSPFVGALIATLAIFLPGFLLILSFYKSYESYSQNPKIASVLKGVNASVVGILLSVLIAMIIPAGIGSLLDTFVALLGLFLIRKLQISIFIVIVLFIVYGVMYV